MTEGPRSDHPLPTRNMSRHGRVEEAPRPLQEGEVHCQLLSARY